MKFVTALLLSLAVATVVFAAEPYRPVSADSVLLQRPPGVAKALRIARNSASSAEPVQAAAAARLAIERAHSSGDPRYFGQAAALLAPWWTTPAPPAEIRLLRASLLQQRHDFAAALTDLDALIAADPDQTQARLIRATVLMVRGTPKAARRDCAALITRSDFLVSATCLGAMNGLSGNAVSGVQAIETALAREPDAPRALRQWAETTAGEIAERLGDTPRATEHYAKALAEASAAGENDVYLKAAHADFLLDQQRADEVRELLQHETEFDALLLRLAIAETRLAAAGDTAAKAALVAHSKDLLSRYALASERGDAAHRREQAMAALHVQALPAAAMALASQNWAEQREPADARILLEAAIATHNKAPAQPVLDWLRDTELEDLRLRPLAAKVMALP